MITESSNVTMDHTSCCECGSVEVTVQQFQYIAANENTSTTKTKKRNVPVRALSKPINQLSTIIRRNRNKPQHTKRGISSSQTESSVESDYVTTTMSSSSISQENDKNKGNTVATRSSSSKVHVGKRKSSHTNTLRPVRSSSDIKMTRGDELLLILSSVSEDDPNCNCLSHDNKNIISKTLPSATAVMSSTKLIKSKSENDLNTFQSLYNIMTSWGENNDDYYDHQNIITCLPPSTANSTSDDEFDDNDTKLVRRNSSLTIDPVSSSQSSFFMNEDFDSSTWLEVNAPSGISILGAAVMTATVVIHPFIFMAGAATATAVWAVGYVHGVEQR